MNRDAVLRVAVELDDMNAVASNPLLGMVYRNFSERLRSAVAAAPEPVACQFCGGFSCQCLDTDLDAE